MMFKKVLLAACALCAVAGVTPSQAKEWKNVTITLEGAYAPWNSTNPDGSLGGFEPELADYLCDHMKVECTLVASDWDSMITSLNAGKFDVVMDALSITPERQEVIAFSIPYANTHAAFAAPVESDYAKAVGTGDVVKMAPDYSGGKDQIAAMRKAFDGATIGIQAGTVYAKFIYDNFKDVATIREYKNGAERDLDLQTGRIDLGFDDTTNLLASFKTADEEMAITGPEIAGNVFGTGEGLGLRKEDTELKAMFDEAIKAAIADGTLEKLSMKWFGTDVSPE
ncbi:MULTISPECIES: transporter substrate-binding domain-containing protein [unclassified Thalassospira]|jgi:octopine/nopaline transport system substrate-binding protein|uniref:transporter substrate-binding domain-containing protein n=1 Tax=unclassified Thalassospira TaxID=2648997 RepID=UPI000A1E9BA8|nr:transporter substrate-binding domain-containing protein [Thalassospira sp. MCCC 1A01428]OSQ43705.1 ABC transporter substrate-binding protein [Thalassospira sp. MCCC 1A01428]